MKNNGFTLAEVLITLTMVGVIASMIIPSFTANTSDKELRTKWKKTFATISSATILLMQDNRGKMRGSFSTASELVDLYATKLNATARCYLNAPTTCWSDKTAPVKTYFGDIDSNWEDAFNPNFGLALIDGSVISFNGNNVDSTCSTTPIFGGSDINEVCVEFYVDVNGAKAPNQIGRDIYFVYINNKDVEPDKGTCSKTSTGMWLNHGCGARWLYSDEDG